MVSTVVACIRWACLVVPVTGAGVVVVLVFAGALR